MLRRHPRHHVHGEGHGGRQIVRRLASPQGSGLTRILVLTAVDVEARALARDLGLARVEGSDWPHYRGGALEIAGVGLRAARLAERAERCGTPTVVISAGACGALAPDLGPGDLVAPEVVLEGDGSRQATDRIAGLARHGVLVTVSEPVATLDAKARLWLATGAMAVDMESAAIIRWARTRGVPVAAVRGVSDTAREALPADLVGLVEPGGRVRTTRALRVALRRPRAIADAVVLGRGTAAAMKTVAAAVARIARDG